MRIGFITDAQVAHLDWAKANGFRSIGWSRFETSPAGPNHKDWQAFAEQLAGEAKTRDIRISAIGAHYRNPLDPEQTEHARSVYLRAIEVAAHIGVKTVCGFPGAVIELERHPKGNNPVYKPFENFIPQTGDVLGVDRKNGRGQRRADRVRALSDGSVSPPDHGLQHVVTASDVGTVLQRNQMREPGH